MASKEKNKFAEAAHTAHKGKAVDGSSGPPPKRARRAEEIIILPPPPAIEKTTSFNPSLLSGAHLQQFLSKLNLSRKRLKLESHGLEASNIER